VWVLHCYASVKQLLLAHANATKGLMVPCHEWLENAADQEDTAQLANGSS
jgi:hypothetical protein